MPRRLALILFLFVLNPGVGLGQLDRYELGRRLKQFESQWEKTSAKEERSRALRLLPAATRQFLTWQNAAAARTLDEATWALISATPPSVAQQWLASLVAMPERRIVDSKHVELLVELRQFYSVPAPSDISGTVNWYLESEKDSAVFYRGTARLDKLPTRVSFTLTSMRPLPEGDHRLRMVIAVGNESTTIVQTLSVVHDLNPRLQRLEAVGMGESSRLEWATFVSHRERLRALRDGEVLETDTPAARLFREAEAFAFSSDQRFFTTTRPGDFWLTVPTAGGKQRTACRLFVPGGLNPEKPVPIVVALHGVGGSENLFFEGYGAGCVVAEAKKRGWFVLAPRGGLGILTGPPPILEIMEQLTERYPIDRGKIVLVGHSLGAAQVVDLVQKGPENYAAAAVLGGGGRVRTVEAFRRVPTLIAVGSADFAGNAAKKLYRDLSSSSGVPVEYREYPEIEHLVIVRAAVSDVFNHYDNLMTRKR